MSYILDALRRAEAQRQQQNPTPPGLGSAPLAAPPDAMPSPGHPAAAQAASTSRPERSTSTGPSAAKLGAAALVVIAIAAALLVSLRQPLRPTPVTAAVPGEDRVAPATPPGPAPAEPAAMLSAPNAPMLQPAAPPAEPPTAPPKTPPVQPASAPPRPTADTVPRYADLPEGVRAGLPAISVQGVTWSENPALRHLIVNGRVLQEGQPIGPDHVLEQIGRDGSVLSYRGQRYRIGH